MDEIDKELKIWFDKEFPDAHSDMSAVYNFLRNRGWNFSSSAGKWRKPNATASNEEAYCVSFLEQEWDF